LPAVAVAEWLLHQGKNRPRFTLIEGMLRYLGRAGDPCSFVSRVNISSLQCSALCPRYRPNRADLDLTAALIQAMKRECDSYGHCQFVMVHWPGKDELNRNPAGMWQQSLPDCLVEIRRSEVAFVDGAARMKTHLGSMGELPDEYFIPRDIHPNARFAERVAGWVDEALRDASGAPVPDP